MTHPLSLSDVQLRLVIKAAQGIAPDWRSRFLENVVDQLFPLEAITNEDVSAAVALVRTRLHMRLKGQAA